MDTDIKQPPVEAPAPAGQSADVTVPPPQLDAEVSASNQNVPAVADGVVDVVQPPEEASVAGSATEQGTSEPVQKTQKPAPAAPKQPSTLPKVAIVIAVIVFASLAVVTYFAYIKGQ